MKISPRACTTRPFNGGNIDLVYNKLACFFLEEKKDYPTGDIIIYCCSFPMIFFLQNFFNVSFPAANATKHFPPSATLRRNKLERLQLIKNLLPNVKAGKKTTRMLEFRKVMCRLLPEAQILDKDRDFKRDKRSSLFRVGAKSFCNICLC